MSGYALTQVVQDGILIAPRWVHHVVKIATSALIVLGAYLVGLSWLWAGLVGGPIFYALLLVHKKVWQPDPAAPTAWDRWADWLNDGALACVPLGVVLGVEYQGIVGWTLMGLCFLLWLFCHPHARP